MRRKALQHLTAFFVFNPELGGEGSEEEQILYFSPRTLDLDTQKNYAGLVSGLVNFSQDFTRDGKKASSLHTLKNRYSFVEVEKDIWITLICKNPIKNPSDPTPEYLTEEVEDSVLETLLIDAYRTFSFFNGPIFSLLEQPDGTNVCRRHLSLFFKYYLPTIPFNQLRFFADINGFRFFPVDRSTYLSVQFLANCVSGQFPQLHSLSVMYSNRLLWSGLPQNAIRVLYTVNQEMNSNYMYGYLARCQNGEELKGNPTSRRKTTIDPEQSAYLVGPLRQQSVTPDDCPKVFIDGQQYRLIALKLRGLYLFWLLDEGTSAVKDENGDSELIMLLRQLQEFVMPQAQKLLQELETHEKRQLDRDEQFRFLYFNHENLALKSILRSPKKKLSSETCRTLRNIHSDFERSNWNVTEVCVRCTDGWVIGRKSFVANRELYLLVDHHEASQLKDVKSQMDHLEQTYFANIFFH